MAPNSVPCAVGPAALAAPAAPASGVMLWAARAPCAAKAGAPPAAGLPLAAWLRSCTPSLTPGGAARGAGSLPAALAQVGGVLTLAAAGSSGVPRRLIEHDAGRRARGPRTQGRGEEGIFLAQGSLVGQFHSRESAWGRGELVGRWGWARE